MTWAVQKIERPVAEVVISREVTDLEGSIALESNFSQFPASNTP
jgi:hypothetical protein